MTNFLINLSKCIAFVCLCIAFNNESEQLLRFCDFYYWFMTALSVVLLPLIILGIIAQGLSNKWTPENEKLYKKLNGIKIKLITWPFRPITAAAVVLLVLLDYFWLPMFLAIVTCAELTVVWVYKTVLTDCRDRAK